MEPLKCKMCGNIALEREGEFFVCRYCGTKYPEKLKMELSGEVKVQGIDTYDTLISRGETFLKLNEFFKAEKVFDEIISLYPNKSIGYAKKIQALARNFSTDVLIFKPETHIYYLYNIKQIVQYYYLEWYEIETMFKNMNVMLSEDDLKNNYNLISKINNLIKEKDDICYIEHSYCEIEEKEKILHQIYKNLKSTKWILEEELKKNNDKFEKRLKTEYTDRLFKNKKIAEEIHIQQQQNGEIIKNKYMQIIKEYDEQILLIQNEINNIENKRKTIEARLKSIFG